MYLTKRGVASVIILSIITLGIYAIWWTYVTSRAMQAQGGKTAIPTVLTTLMALVSSSVWGALLALDADDNLNAIKARHGMPQADNKLLWLILGIFIPIVVVGLVQYEINTMIEAAEKAARAPAAEPTQG